MQQNVFVNKELFQKSLKFYEIINKKLEKKIFHCYENSSKVNKEQQSGDIRKEREEEDITTIANWILYECDSPEEEIEFDPLPWSPDKKSN